MATGYGTATPSYGYYKPPQVSRVGTGNRSLAMAAANTPTQNDPFGLLGASGPQNQGIPGSVIAYGTPAKGAAPPASAPTSAATNPSIPKVGSAINTAPIAQPYDVNLDPVVQQLGSFADMTDQEAQAAALKQKQDTLLGYGDANLAQSLLGDQAIAQAAGANPTSTLSQLGQERTRNLTGLTEGLNKANLLYSGYRVNQEDQAGQDYQNQLAAAAAAVGGQLGTIDQNLSSQLGQSRAQRVQALLDAYSRHATDAGAGSDTTGTGADGSGAGDVLNTQPGAPALSQLAYAAGIPGDGSNPNPTYAQLPPSPTNATIQQLLKNMGYA